MVDIYNTWEQDSINNFSFLDTSSENATEDMVFDSLAEIIVDIYFSGIEIEDPNDTPELTALLTSMLGTKDVSKFF